MIADPLHPSVGMQNRWLEQQINKYVDEILAMVLPENVKHSTSEYELNSEENIARKLIKDFTTMQVYQHELEKVYRKSINSLSFGKEFYDCQMYQQFPPEVQNFARHCLDASYVEHVLAGSTPKKKYNKRGIISKKSISRYAAKTFKSNPLAKYHKLRLDFENEYRYDYLDKELDTERDGLLQMKPILMLREMFASGFDISKLNKVFDTKSYKTFEDGIEGLKNNYSTFLSNYMHFNDTGFNLASPEANYLGVFVNYKHDMLLRSHQAASFGVDALDGVNVEHQLHKYKHTNDFKDIIKSYTDIFERGFANLPEDPKKRKIKLREFNKSVVDTIMHSTDAEVDCEKVMKSLEHFENKMIHRVQLGLYPLSKSFRKKDVSNLKYTTITHRQKMIKRIESDEEKINPVAIGAVGAITFATSFGIFMSSPMDAPNVPIITNSVFSSITSTGITKLIEQAIVREKHRTHEQDEKLTELGRLLLEGRYLLYNLFHTKKRSIDSNEERLMMARVHELALETGSLEHYIEQAGKGVEEVERLNSEFERQSEVYSKVVSSPTGRTRRSDRRRIPPTQHNPQDALRRTEYQRAFWREPPETSSPRHAKIPEGYIGQDATITIRKIDMNNPKQDTNSQHTSRYKLKKDDQER